jgi:hypothetical protein
MVVPAENCGMIRDHKGEHHLHGAAYWQRAAEVAEARVKRVTDLADSWGMATVITGNPRSDAMRKLVEELREALS